VGPKDQILARMYAVLTLLSLLPLLVAGQVVRLYLVEGGELREQGEDQAYTHEDIPAMRGAILDQAGRTLAVNAARYDLALDPTIPGFQQEAASFFERLSTLTGRSNRALRRAVANRASPQYVLLLRAITEVQKEAIEAWDVPGVILQPTFARRYNYGSTAAHVLGHVSADGQGLAGVELQYDDRLRGEAGRRAVQRDRRGIVKAAVGASVVPPKHGETVVLTLDLIRQTILEEELARGVEKSGANWGTAIAMNPQTGAILALANVPTYNPNRPGAAPTARRRNHAVTDRMEPGSTFKVVGAAAAIERGLVTMTDSIETGDGWGVFGGRTLRDTRAHGTLPFKDVIALSSNVGMAHVVSQMDPGVLYQYARNFGFGQPTWIDLPGEVSGTLKRPAAWSGTSLTRIAIGYEVDATPLQLLAAYGALANGGMLMEPYLVAERRDLTGRTLWQARPTPIRRVMKAETARTLLPAFQDVVEDGTATRARIDGLPVAGKTGTARKVSRGGYEQGAYRASFVGFFPADDPQVVLVVVLDEPAASAYGGVVAAPIFRRVAERWLTTLPDVARRVAPSDTLSPPVLHVAAIGQALPDEATTTMPDFTGRSVRTALHWLGARGVAVRIDGRGRVVDQHPRPGTPLPERAVLRGRG
jgi:cell division protein FtsI (penicillin-binding protein 3)